MNEIAAVTKRPEDVIGLHFFSPANIMRLLEIVRGAKTSKKVIATSMKLAKTLDKIGVLVGVCHGFVGNRMLYPYRREALFLLEEGALPQQVDKAITDFGFAMGPFAVSDLAGLDIGWRVRKAQGKPRGRALLGHDRRPAVRAGHYGQKTGQGFYKYEAGQPHAASRTPELEQLVMRTSERARHRAPRDLGRRDRGALHLRDDQRGLQDPRRGHRAARQRHRPRVAQRLRLPGLPRRADVLRRSWSGCARSTRPCRSSANSTASTGSLRPCWRGSAQAGQGFANG